jgi:hypothetical protein
LGVFGQSIFATPPVIGGVQLRAFSAYHALALMELDSPYMGARREPTEGDTATAILVCSMRRVDGLEAIRRALSSPIARIRWALYWLFHNHVKTGNDISDHITASMAYPEVWRDTGDGDCKSTGADWPYYVVSVIAQNMHGVAYVDIWDMPLAELNCHKAIITECNGDAQIAENELRLIESRREKGAA